MPRSYEEIVQKVKAGQILIQQMDETAVAPDSPLGGIRFQREYDGWLAVEDDLVVGIGERVAGRLFNPDYPLSDLYFWFQALIQQMEEQFGGARGQIEVTVRVVPAATGG